MSNVIENNSELEKKKMEFKKRIQGEESKIESNILQIYIFAVVVSMERTMTMQ